MIQDFKRQIDKGIFDDDSFIYMYLPKNFARIGELIKQNKTGVLVKKKYQNDAERGNSSLINSAHQDRVIKLPGLGFSFSGTFFGVSLYSPFLYYWLIKKNVSFSLFLKNNFSDKKAGWLWLYLNSAGLLEKKSSIYKVIGKYQNLEP